MPFVSITRLKLRSIFNLPAFLFTNEASAKTLVKTDGFLSGKELTDKNLTFWTLTIWENDAAMKSFRNSAAHKKAMQKLPFWCSEGSYFHWIQDDETLPPLAFAAERLLKEGKTTKVRKPSANQLANNFPPVKWTKLERSFKPASKN
ncbi:MAG: hypothetical protein ABJA78_06985 [Ferruginibacter sp.]